MDSPQNIYEKLVTLGTEWAELHAAAEILEETKKTLLAQLTLEAEGSSMSAKENHAMASKPYDEHIRRMVLSRKRANTAKVKYDSAKVWVDLMRTKEASDRAATRNA